MNARTRRLGVSLLLVGLLAGCPSPGSLTLAEPGGDTVDGELLVRIKAGVSSEQAIALHHRLGATPLAELSPGLWRVQVPSGLEREAMARFRSESLVSYSEANRRTHPQMVGGFRPFHGRLAQAVPVNDPLYVANPLGPNQQPREGLPGQWGLESIGTFGAWDKTQGRSDVVVAVLDTGVDMGHPDLEANLDRPNARNFVERDTPPDDDFGHGTHVAGIIGAVANNAVGIAGVAPRCKVMPLRVLGVEGGTTASLVEGIEWAIQHQARVLNLSLGSSQYSRAEADAVARAIAAGVVVVAAAGNEALSGNPPSYPGSLEGVISVGAVRKDTTGYLRAEFSTFNPFVTVAAPGVDILSTVPRRFQSRTSGIDSPYAYASGTSMAAPMVAGVVALMLSAHPEWKPADVVARLRQTAFDLGPSGLDSFFGAGLVQAAEAVR